MLWEVDMLHKFPLSGGNYHTNALSFVTYVEIGHKDDYESVGIYPQEIAVQQAINKFFMAGNGLHPGSSIEIVRIESVDSEAL